MAEFLPGTRAVVVGAGGGIGQALTDKLLCDDRIDHIYALARSCPGVRPRRQHPRLSWIDCDITDAVSIHDAVARIKAATDRIHLVIIASGVLHRNGLSPEKRIGDIDADNMAEVFRINSIGPVTIASALIPMICKETPAVLAAISARVGSISDNRMGGWYAYRASKAALNMLFKTLSIELRRSHPRLSVAVLHPGTTDTKLSRPFQRNVPPGKLFSPETTAGYLIDVISRLTPSDSGGFYAWDGQAIDW